MDVTSYNISENRLEAARFLLFISRVDQNFISSMIGGPLFIWILVRQRKSAWA